MAFITIYKTAKEIGQDCDQRIPCIPSIPLIKSILFRLITPEARSEIMMMMIESLHKVPFFSLLRCCIRTDLEWCKLVRTGDKLIGVQLYLVQLDTKKVRNRWLLNI